MAQKYLPELNSIYTIITTNQLKGFIHSIPLEVRLRPQRFRGNEYVRWNRLAGSSFFWSELYRYRRSGVTCPDVTTPLAAPSQEVRLYNPHSQLSGRMIPGDKRKIRFHSQDSFRASLNQHGLFRLVCLGTLSTGKQSRPWAAGCR